MNPEPSSAIRDVSFPVVYQEHVGAHNARLRGEGAFTIAEEEPRYGFSGKARAVWSKAKSVSFHSAQIENVSVAGRKVTFYAHPVNAGDIVGPFVFYCTTPAEARNAAARLPQQNAFAAGSPAQLFAEKLALLPLPARPWKSATNVIIAVNGLAFVGMGLMGAGWIDPASMAPYIGYFANNAGATTDGEWWRIVTCMFIHYGILHLLLNMWALFQAGHFVERLLGRSLFVLAYFGSGIAASFATIFWHGDRVWSAGASGAVFGVYGMLFGFALRERESVPKESLRPMLKSALTFAGYNLFYGMIVPQIDNAAHLGGLIGGAVFGWFVARPVEKEKREGLWSGRFALGGVVLAAAIAAGIGFSPRFDYRFREELRWGEVNREAIAQEPALVARQQAEFAKLGPGKSSAALAAWLEREGIPFYEDWRAKIDALALTPGRRTERSRQALSAKIQAKLSDYRRWVDEARAP